MSATIKIKPFLDIIRFDKPIGTLLLLWPTLWALWIAAEGVPDSKLLIIFILGTFLMRSAGCIVNDIADRKLDAAVKRTTQRPLVTGAISVNQALIFCSMLCMAAFTLVLFTNTLTIALSLGGVLLASVYPFMKRYTHLPQLVLGAAFSWGIPMAFAAQMDQLPAPLWLIYAGNFLWIVAYDTQYAMVDREDDIKVGAKSTAILFGDADIMVIAVLQLFSLIALTLAGLRFELGLYYYLSLLIAAAFFVYHQHLIKNRQPERCFKAFLHNNWVGMVIFLGIAAHFQLSGAP